MVKDKQYWDAVETLKNLLDELRKAEKGSAYGNLDEMEEKRESVFSHYGKIFQNIDTLSKEDFQEFLSFHGNKHWKTLERHKNHLTEDMKDLKRVLKICLDETKPIGTRIDDSFEKKYFGKGIATAFLLVAFKGKYAVWNGTSEGALKKLNVWPDFPRGSSDGEKYDSLNQFLNEFSKDVSTDLWVLDWLFWIVDDMFKQQPQIPEEIIPTDQKYFPEGRNEPRTVNRYERDLRARKQCLKHYGAKCFICSFDFSKVYGSQYDGIIHVHHITPLSEVTDMYKVDPIKDLIPVCPNCHAVIHKKRPSLTKEQIDELKENIKSRGK